jgi:hypothetical protein
MFGRLHEKGFVMQIYMRRNLTRKFPFPANLKKLVSRKILLSEFKYFKYFQNI